MAIFYAMSPQPHRIPILIPTRFTKPARGSGDPSSVETPQSTESAPQTRLPWSSQDSFKGGFSRIFSAILGRLTNPTPKKKPGNVSSFEKFCVDFFTSQQVDGNDGNMELPSANLGAEVVNYRSRGLRLINHVGVFCREKRKQTLQPNWYRKPHETT